MFLFWQEEEEENIIETKEPPLREGEEDYYFNFSSFFDRKRRNLSLKINTPPWEEGELEFFFFFFWQEVEENFYEIKTPLREGEKEFFVESFHPIEKEKNIFLLFFLKNESRRIIFGSPSWPFHPPPKKNKNIFFFIDST